MATESDIKFEATNSPFAANKIVSETDLKIAYTVIGTLGMTGNVFVVVVILNYKSMRKQLTNTYILNQVNYLTQVAWHSLCNHFLIRGCVYI